MRQKKPIFAGTAQRDITPEVGVDLSGYVARDNPSTGIHDPLYAKALCLTFGEERFVLVCADLVALHCSSVRKIQAKVFEKTALPSTHLLLTTTHTHSGVATAPLRECGTPDAKVVEWIEKQIIEAIEESMQEGKKASVGFGRTEVKEPIIFNRRDPNNGPVDEELFVMYVDDQEGNPMAAWVNFTCHAVVLPATNKNISADFPGALTRRLEESRGGMAMFSNGACGDINPYHGDFEAVENMGEILAENALKALANTEKVECGKISIRSREVSLPFAPLASLEQLERIREQFEKTLKDSTDPTERRIARAHLDYVHDTLAMLDRGETPEPLKTELKVVHIDDHFIVSFSGEVLVAIGKEIKKLSPGQVAFVGYCDGCAGYIPTKPEFEKGGYEASGAWMYYGYNAPFLPGIGEKVIEVAIELIEEEFVNG